MVWLNSQGAGIETRAAHLDMVLIGFQRGHSRVDRGDETQFEHLGLAVVPGWLTLATVAL